MEKCEHEKDPKDCEVCSKKPAAVKPAAAPVETPEGKGNPVARLAEHVETRLDEFGKKLDDMAAGKGGKEAGSEGGSMFDDAASVFGVLG